MNTLGLVFQGLGLGLVAFSTINLRLLYLKLIVTAIYSLSKKKKRKNPRQPNRVQYNLYPFFIFFHVLLFFTGAAKLKKLR